MKNNQPIFDVINQKKKKKREMTRKSPRPHLTNEKLRKHTYHRYHIDVYSHVSPTSISATEMTNEFPFYRIIMKNKYR